MISLSMFKCWRLSSSLDRFGTGVTSRHWSCLVDSRVLKYIGSRIRHSEFIFFYTIEFEVVTIFKWEGCQGC